MAIPLRHHRDVEHVLGNLMTDIVWNHTVTNLPDATVGVPYEYGLPISGNATAVAAVTVTSGSLAGTGFSVAGDLSRITGTPTTAAGRTGSITVKLTATDTAGAVQSGNLTIRVGYAGVPIDKPTDTTVAAQIAKAWPLL
jgi:hypothetical protein